MQKIIHFSRKKLSECSRMQAQVELDHGSVYVLKNYLSFREPLDFIKSLSRNKSAQKVTCIFHQQRSLLILLLCYFVAGSKNVRFVYDMHDLNEMRKSSGLISRIKDKVFYLVSYFFEWLVSRSKIDVITVSKGLSRIFYLRYRKSCTLFYNTPSQDFIESLPGDNKSSDHDKIRICYFGVIKDARLPNYLLLDLIRREVLFDIYGTVAPEYKSKLAELKIFDQPTVFYRGAYQGGAIISTLAEQAYDYTLCVFDVNTVNLRFSMPNKVFQSLWAGIPVLSAHELKELLFTFRRVGGASLYPSPTVELPSPTVDRAALSLFLNRFYHQNKLRYLRALELEPNLNA